MLNETMTSTKGKVGDKVIFTIVLPPPSPAFQIQGVLLGERVEPHEHMATLVTFDCPLTEDDLRVNSLTKLSDHDFDHFIASRANASSTLWRDLPSLVILKQFKGKLYLVCYENFRLMRDEKGKVVSIKPELLCLVDSINKELSKTN